MDARTIARFEAKVDRSGGTDACHPWVGGLSRGYGRINVGGRSMLAHRVAFFLEHGRWPEPCCCHRCDNPKCCNPAHLWQGTVADNDRDRDAKGRTRGTYQAGGLAPLAKLTEDQVGAIRAAAGTMSHRKLASMYGVTHTTVGNILRGGTWRTTPPGC